MTTPETTAWQLEGRGIDELREVRMPVEPLAPTEIRIAVGAVALNYRDLLVIEGSFLTDLERPFVPGSDASGRIVEVGSDVTRFRVGERVLTHFWVDWIGEQPPVRTLADARSLGGPLPGVLAKQVTVDQEHAVHAPEQLDDAEAATLPIAGLTAYCGLLRDGSLDASSTVLIQGTGGVACFGTQLAAAAGSRVIVTSSSPDKLGEARRLGATDVIDRNARPDWHRAVIELTAGRGVDRVLELGGGEGLQQSVQTLSFGGEIVQVGFIAGAEAGLVLPTLMLRQARIRGVSVGSRDAFEEFVQWIDRNGLAPRIDSIHEFDAADEAFRRLEAGPLGKVVVTC
ncbi:MAG: NAD(P)-dependent alcohol dehydrogenase [Gammaproteobacteria bacterium]|nr:NAD(P)-dependent alcohol dehydrogenase [Gammaproteobacteria bacterium]